MKNSTLVVLCFGFSLFGYSQTKERNVATLNTLVKSWDLLVNNQPVHTIKFGELFYYYTNSQSVCTKNSKVGKIPDSIITIIDSIKYIRFEFLESDLKFQDDHEDLIQANKVGIDYITLVQKAISKNEEALIEILKIELLLDGAALECFGDRFWKIFHFWSDSDLVELIKKDNEIFNQRFSEFIFNEFYTGFSENEIIEYFKLFYPETLILVIKEE